jgi:3',5'-cyclic AMP phosphodiesterase CpdA
MDYLPMFTLAHLSDPHLAPLPSPRWPELAGKRVLGYLNWLRKRRAIHRSEVLAEIVRDVKNCAPDHIAVTGDLVNISLAEEFAPARAWLDALGPPDGVTVVPGNHDAYVRDAAPAAMRHWAPFMSGDTPLGPHPFPFVRRRGPLALIGVSTAVPTAPFMATGWLGGDQLERLGEALAACRSGPDVPFRVVLIHHPPAGAGAWHKRLTDAPAFRRVIAQCGAELVIHGHDHVQAVNWLDGPAGRIPAVGAASASAALGMDHENAGYNLFRIEQDGGEWRFTVQARSLQRDGRVHGRNSLEFRSPVARY